ncbi:hypothetical protein E0H88_12725 [Acinetobacter sp. ANC 4216]|uniref:hypothetical protein n=1 Tax=Acinetobacter sp. ANC 4216 TaxID=2529840 RepID=UPI00103BB2B8|nr:hypothetical protein [Acinetobacter sp. ANC 4216]TCB67387.1 hypothetical protein E0H88_12725 [Acinetobacter sp. ANC 4216]
MATDVDVQYFSHLNDLTLGNNWGDLIRLLDKALVTGIDFTQITAASIDEQGDVHITLYAAHNAMLFQVVELSGFTPSSLNQKYRIKGVPNTTQLILKSKNDIAQRAIITIGTGKLASLGYDIIFRDTNDVKRVYRAKNPRSEHPFIRVDESLTSPDGTTGVYTPTYAKSAMVGLLERMDHIDDYEKPDVLQLPFNPNDPAKNWKITGTGATVVRGWAKWYWARGSAAPNNTALESSIPASGSRNFTLTGDSDAFYLQLNPANFSANKQIMGCGLYSSALLSDVIPNWFLMTTLKDNAANNNTLSESVPIRQLGSMPLLTDQTSNRFFVPKYDLATPLSPHALAVGILPTTTSGVNNLYPSSAISALEIPFYSEDGYLRGSLKHIYFSGKYLATHTASTALLGENHCFVADSVHSFAGDNNLVGGVYYYLGAIE